MVELPAEIVPVLDRLVPAIHGALGQRVRSIVLWGSAALGDYRPGRSDVDLIVGLDADPDPETVSLLGPVHDGLVAAMPAFRDRVEVAYVGLASLAAFRARPHTIARISPGEPLNLRTADGAWLIDWFQAGTTGVALHGPAASTVMPHVSADEVRAEAARQLQRDIAIPDDAAPGTLAYIVLRACRALHAVDRGTQASKAGAGGWLAARNAPWSSLIEAATLTNDGGSPSVPLTMVEVERFLAWARQAADRPCAT